MDMKAVIQQRKSCRSFNGKALSLSDEGFILDYISNEDHLVGVFGHKVTIHYIKSLGKNMETISTYGVVKKAPAYLVAVCENTRESMVDCGYVFEKLILALEAKGLGTCWLGGTFKRKQLSVSVGSGEFIPIISPVGYSDDRRTFADKTTRWIAGSNKRKENEALFFFENLKTPLSNPELLDRLSYVRLAPSASNNQPWRMVMDAEGKGHLYIERTPNYGFGKLGYDIQMVDMGIAMCHYEIANDGTEFVHSEPGLALPNQHYEYVISMV